jgi:preprotein translocase subunit SecA
LAEPEKDILRRVYAVHRYTYIPSIFGKNNRIFNPTTDVQVVEETKYYTMIRGEIDVMCNANRAILVFFESEKKLMAFYNSTELSSIKPHVEIITEKTLMKEREICIGRAAKTGRVTLLTRTFGRGVDFVCRDQQLLANGGIHVLQTFFSEELSEEYQIMERGARQGDCGSYHMILLDKDLEWVLGSSWKEELSKIIGSNLYQALNNARRNFYEIKCVVKHLKIKQCRCEHRESIDFMFALYTGEMQTVKLFLTEQNQGANSLRPVTKKNI